eukprot:scaffold1093_cov61-Cylindrotheca_fusiformis.AAC.1
MNPLYCFETEEATESAETKIECVGIDLNDPLCRGLVRVGLQKGLEQIGEFAFWECERLVRVEIPSTVRVIGDNTFMEQCSVSRRIPQGKFAFSGCGCLSVVVIPATVKVVDIYAFEWCRALERVGLQEGLEEIGECAFSGCDSLAEVDIPSTISARGDNAFMRNCSISQRSSQASRQ